MVKTVGLPATWELSSIYHPDIAKQFILCTAKVEQGWTYDGKTFSVPVPVTVDLETAKTNAKAQIVSMFDAAASIITAGAPLAEQLSWPVKQESARAYLAGTATDEQKIILQAEASITGETLDSLCATILASVEQFAAASGMLAGLRRSSNAEIDAASDTAAISAAIAKVEAALKTLTNAS